MKITKATLRKLIKEEIEGMEQDEVDPEEALLDIAYNMEDELAEMLDRLDKLDPQIRKVFQEIPGWVLNKNKRAEALQALDNGDLDHIFRFFNYIKGRYNRS